MKPLLRVFFLCLGLANATYAAQGEVSPPLWSVASPTSTVYLLGTLHVGKKSFYPLPQVIEQALFDADTLSVEVDLLGPEMAKALSWMMLNSALPQGQDLQDILTKPTLMQLKQRLQALKIPFASVRHLKPWVVAMNLSNIYLAKSGFQSALGVDFYVLRKAKTMHKPVLSIESARDQFNVFDQLPWPEQEAFLRTTLEETADFQQQLEAMIEAWASGDLSALKTRILDPMAQDRGNKMLFKYLFVERNRRMTDAIVRLTRQPGQHFVAVGAAHFLGDNGIVEMLRKKGMQVQRVRL